jgi:hypothetical protein
MRRMINHLSHGLGDAIKGHHKPNIAQDGAPKKVTGVEIHPGMTTRSKSGGDCYGGDHKSALDSLTGTAVVPGAIKSAPGWGNASARTGHPFAKPIPSKNIKRAEVAFGQSRGADEDAKMHDLGAEILKSAVRN